MARNKLAKFAQLNTFTNTIQPTTAIAMSGNSELKGKWNTHFFKNNNPIIVEMGCGMGEYTIALATMFPENNYIGIDIKGARMYHGAKKAVETGMTNVAFIKTKVEFLKTFFGKEEISEIWLTFSDPQPKYKWKRLSSAYYLNLYANFLKPDAIVHVKTDSLLLYDYSIDLISKNNLKLLFATEDVYGLEKPEPILLQKTKYEQIAIERLKKITYIKFGTVNTQNFEDTHSERYYRQYVRAYDTEE